MIEREVYYDNIVHRVVFSYDINRLVVELRGSNQQHKMIFTDTLYYNNTDVLKNKHIQQIQELDQTKVSNAKRVSLLKDLSKRIPLSKDDLERFIEAEGYKVYELVAETNKTAYVIAKDVEFLLDAARVAS